MADRKVSRRDFIKIGAAAAG
ncbi:MAG: twin-arginine translocation signal domain-containing protein, partial [Chloroflexi bacterium]|nr:twin-arginine translocation signal domain-containing protein [Chloroflexota bacterium]